MALAQVLSRACVGVEAPLITVEVHLAGGLPCVSIVGYIKPNYRPSRFPMLFRVRITRASPQKLGLNHRDGPQRCIYSNEKTNQPDRPFHQFGIE